MNRFFVEEDQICGNKIEITGQDTKHIRDVLRLNVGHKIEVISNRKKYISEIKSISKSLVEVEILEMLEGENEPPIEIRLFQGLAKGSKMDLIIQKSIEVGVTSIYPVLTDRSIVKINNMKKEQSKVERWNSIADGAAKQSKRDIVPLVNNILSFKEMLALLGNDRDRGSIIVPYEDEKALGIKEVLRSGPISKVNIIIGPEGGFAQEEIQELRAIGSSIVSLGPRILRTETAGVVSSAIVLYELGDLGVII